MKGEESVSNDFEMALAEMIGKAQTSVIEPWVFAAQWKDELIKLAKSEEPVSEQNLSNVQSIGKNWKDPVSEDLEEYINELSKQFPEVSFAKLSRIAVRVAKWQREQFEKNRLKHCNSITKEQAELEQEFIDKHLDKHQRMPTFLDAIEHGMELQKKNATAVTVHEDAGGYPYIPQIELYDYDKDIPLAKEGDKYKVVLIKED